MFQSDKKFIIQYLETALWSSIDIDDNPMDQDYDINDIDFNSIKRTVKDCLKFINEAEKLNLLDNIEYDQAGHDFWLTRNHHATGFWDRQNGAIGDQLTELCNNFKEVNCTSYAKKDDDKRLVELY